MREMNHIFHQPVLLLMMAAALLIACSSDSTEAPTIPAGDNIPAGQLVHIVSYASSYVEQIPAHRAAPAGFTAYTPTQVTDMGVYVLLPDDWASPQEELIKYVAKWHAYFNVDKGKTYTVYGYMPKMEGMGSTLTKATADAAVLNLTGIKSLSTDDICIITGVKENETELKEGNFSWYQDIEKEDYHIYLLMEHLYAGVQFRLTINEDYAQLRTIKLKSMMLKSDKGSGNVAITLTHNTTGASPITNIDYTLPASSGQVEIYNSEEGTALSNLTAVVANAYFIETLQGSLTLESTYDVYNKKGNLVRANCTATNVIPDLGVTRGQRMQVNMTVDPTYLYQLSDDDLDNLLRIE